MQFSGTAQLSCPSRLRLVHQQGRIPQEHNASLFRHMGATTVARAAPIPDLGDVVWDLPPATAAADHARVRTHAIHGTPPMVSEVVPLSLDNLQPANLTKPALLQFLQAQLKTRAAVQKAVHAIVLSAPYLPSQIDTITDLAAKSDIITCCFISSTNLHMLLIRQPVFGWDSSIADQHTTASGAASSGSSTSIPPEAATLLTQLLSSTFKGLQPLPPERLAAARSTEQTLNKQLRLWHPPTWTETLNQKLLSRKAPGSGFIVIKSLMGPPGLEAARKLVESKPGLVWTEREVEVQQQQEPAGSSAGSSSSSSSSSRRRPGRSGAASPTAAAADPSFGHSKELLVVISSFPLPAEILDQLPAELYTDYVAGSPAGGSAASHGIQQGVLPGQLGKLLKAIMGLTSKANQ